jgi:hypothetical protein
VVLVGRWSIWLITADDEGVRARMWQMFAVDWTDPLLYDLVINTGAVGVFTAVGQVLGLTGAAEFQPTAFSRQLVSDRALAARVRAILKATPSSAHVELDVQSSAGHVHLAGRSGRSRRGTRRSPPWEG